MKNNYLLEYSDTFSYSKQLEKIIKKEKFVGSMLSEYDLEEVELDIVLEDLDTYSFLTDKKIIVVKSVDMLDITQKKTEHFLKYLEDPDPNKLLIMSSTRLDARKKITKELKKFSEYMKLENDPFLVIKKELEDYKMENGVIQLIQEYTNNHLDAIKTECDKLKQYKFEEKEITKEDVEKICYKHIDDTTQLTFDLVRYISSINKKEALITYQKLYTYQIEDIQIIALLESQLRLLEQVGLLMDQNMRRNDIASFLDVHPYRIEKTQELLRDLSKKEVDFLIKKLGDLDFNIKSGVYDIKKPLEMFILNL